MTKFDIDKNVLLSYLQACSLTGDIANRELLVTIKDQSINATAAATNKSVAMQATLTGKFADLGQVGIDFVPVVVEFLRSAATAKTITVSVTDTKLILQSGKTKFTTTVRNPKYITNSVPEDKFRDLVVTASGTTFFTLKPADVLQIVKYAQLVGAPAVTITGTATGVTISFAGSRDEVDVPIENVGKAAPFKVRLGRAVLDVLDTIKNMDCDVQVSMPESAKMVRMSVAATDLNLDYILAPLSK
jgi:hypothetical protein